ncbi:MAG: DNA polymerase IV [Rhodospirillaceae bacterium]
MGKNLCRDCSALSGNGVTHCSQCGSGRLVAHEELAHLCIAHLDCDAFYAAIEKRDNPALKDKPLLIGGDRRGVVSTACYIARQFGPRSAMPMYKALKLCPDAVVMRPNMSKYREVSHEIRTILKTATPLVEPVSVDEAFLDLAGTERLHGGPPATTLATIARQIETKIGITVSIGLSYNKLLAKMASELDKPRGFALIGQQDAVPFLRKQSIGAIPGVGPALSTRLQADGFFFIGDLQTRSVEDLERLYGDTGRQLGQLSYGQDLRQVRPGQVAKSISTERTFEKDIYEMDILVKRLWLMCEEVSDRLKEKCVSSSIVTLKLKTSAFRTYTRTTTLRIPTQLAEVLFRTTQPILQKEHKRGPFRLIGIGTAGLNDSTFADIPDLLNEDLGRIKDIETAVDSVRTKFGKSAIRKGRID